MRLELGGCERRLSEEGGVVVRLKMPSATYRAHPNTPVHDSFVCSCLKQQEGVRSERRGAAYNTAKFVSAKLSRAPPILFVTFSREGYREVSLGLSRSCFQLPPRGIYDIAMLVVRQTIREAKYSGYLCFVGGNRLSEI